jgi:malate permease and related proteins
MDIFGIVFESTLALLGIGVIGFLVARRGFIPENVISVLSRLAIDIALPALVLANILLNFSVSDNPDWWLLPLWWLMFAAISLVLTLLTMLISQKSTRSEFAIGLFFQNALFLPLIIITGIFGAGNAYLAQLFIFTMLHPSLMFSTYHLFFRNKEAAGTVRIQITRIINPILIVTIIAIIIQMFNAVQYIPAFIDTLLQILGGMTIPLIMIILGGSLYIDFQKKGKIYWMEIIKFVVVKNLLFPAVFLGVVLLIKPAYNIALMIILQSAVPPITAIPIIAERAGGNRAIANQFTFASFLAALITLPLVISVFNILFPGM